MTIFVSDYPAECPSCGHANRHRTGKNVSSPLFIALDCYVKKDNFLINKLMYNNKNIDLECLVEKFFCNIPDSSKFIQNTLHFM